MDKTYVPKGQQVGEWHLVDAAGESLGRLATQIARLLIGKHHVDYTPGVLMGDHVVVINASQVKVSQTRVEEKKYYTHSGYPGGLHSTDFSHQLAEHPDRVIRLAVRGMLPKNRLTARYLANLKIYAGSEHPHQAQEPQALEQK